MLTYRLGSLSGALQIGRIEDKLGFAHIIHQIATNVVGLLPTQFGQIPISPGAHHAVQVMHRLGVLDGDDVFHKALPPLCKLALL